MRERKGLSRVMKLPTVQTNEPTSVKPQASRRRSFLLACGLELILHAAPSRKRVGTGRDRPRPCSKGSEGGFAQS